MAKTGTKLQGIMGTNSCLAHLMFSYWRGKSYTAMEEHAYCFFNGYNILKIEKEIYVH